jgi:hypothetical protein
MQVFDTKTDVEHFAKSVSFDAIATQIEGVDSEGVRA